MAGYEVREQGDGEVNPKLAIAVASYLQKPEDGKFLATQWSLDEQTVVKLAAEISGENTGVK